MKNYRLYIVDPENIDKTDLSYQEVKDAAIDYFEADEADELLRNLIAGLNDDNYSDQNYFVITDEENGIILYS